MPLRLPRVRLTRRRLVAGSVVLVVVAAFIGWAVWPASKPFASIAQMITVQTGPSGNEPVTLDTTLYLPTSASSDHPVPAVLLAHGFGGTKDSVVSDAEDFAGRGYAVLTWTAQGFGRSGGEIHLDSPDYEVRDAQRLIDWLAARPDIAKDATGPKVAAVGGSYGGALSLMLASQDTRVDAIVPMITWNDLSRSFLPNGTGQGPDEGVFKKQWAGLFFGSGSGAGGPAGLLGGLGTSGTTGGGSGTGPDGGTGGGSTDGGTVGGAPLVPGATASPSAAAGATASAGASAAPGATRSPDAPGGLGAGALANIDPACGRFAKDVCAAYLDVATNGKASQSTIDLLRRSSPVEGVSRIKAPTLLIQGQADSLFPLSDAEANYRSIAANGTPVRMDWFTGGHDGGQGPQSDQDRLKFLTITWLDYYLMGKGDKPGTGFTFSRVSGFDAESRRLTTSGFSSDVYPDQATQVPIRVPIAGPPQRIANPPDSNPAAITVLPGTGSGGLSSLLNGASLEIPGQHADYYSAPLASNTDVVGLPTVQIRAASPTGEAVLFVKLYDVDPQAGASLPFGLTSPVRLTGLPTTIDQAEPVPITLPGIVYRFEAGHRLRISVATSDQAFSTPVDPTVYTIALPDSGTAVTLPQLTGTPIANPEVIWRYVLAGVVGLIVLGVAAALIVARIRRRRRMVSVVAEFADTPLVVRGLRKEYADGFVAVSKVDFTVQRGQVVGLLGPNGAGKTTSLRVLLGMTQPTAGEILVFGHHLKPGSEVLTRLGALVEGPGFLPHVTGLRNLQLYWQSTGRPAEEARLDEALDIAGLGDAIHRKVRKYSHGMKQRLAIAQAMLGLPELLVLDEPTDGLDPPQIAEMRKVLRAYATNGRAVLVSSHLLAEVEQTCTHVVVMNKGLVVADGPVDDVVGDSPIAQFEVSDVDAATAVLDDLSGIRSVTPDGRSSLIVDLNGTARTDVVAALVRAGIGVDRVVPRRRLEDAFLTLVGGDSKASGER